MGKKTIIEQLDWKKIIDKCKGMKKNQVAILLLVGLLIFVVILPTKEKPKTTAESTKSETLEKQDLKEEQDMTGQLEERLKRTLRRIDSVGEVEVMITMKSKGEKIIEKDRPKTSKDSVEIDSQGGSRNTKEIISQEGTVYIKENGKEVPYVVEELAPKIEGVLVIAQGADQSNVIKNIYDAIMALFPVEPHKIKVVKMNVK